MATASRDAKIVTVSCFASSLQLLPDCPGHVLCAPQPIVDGWLGILPHVRNTMKPMLHDEVQLRIRICT